MAKNYYVILGVDPDASPDQIRSAYRRKAKQLHPDCYDGGSEPFRNVQEAYEALSDPQRRECYDAERARQRRQRASSYRAPAAPWRVYQEPLRSRGSPVEPLIPDEPWRGRERSPPARFAPFADPLERLWDDLEGWFEPAARRREVGRVVIPLTRAQAARGGQARVWLTVQVGCPNCGGTGGTGFYGCSECAGEGRVVQERPVWILFPAGVEDGFQDSVSLAPLGAPDAELRVRFHVRDEGRPRF